ncbi:hypothetical protein R1sor_009827 [Riccia sorocarpa]|uniref:Uncharacterized protein n=1 Tax=Riccia sorocarpa TaxID=122646 RepID=A0ABD3HXZ2_9MARC
MDFDVIDDTRPRLQLQSGPVASASEERRVDIVQAAICCSIGVALLGFGFTLIVPLQFLAIWLGLSLIVGPFAPISVTGGDCRVGVGEEIPHLEEAETTLPETTSSRNDNRNLFKKPSEVSRDYKPAKDADELVSARGWSRNTPVQKNGTVSETDLSKGDEDEQSEESGFTYAEFVLLKKLLIKHPRGTLKRWDVIAEAMGGRHSADSVVRMSKALAERKISDQDSYAKFLAQRKTSDVSIASPLSHRSEFEGGAELEEDNNVSSESDALKGQWTEGEDKALVKALKTFPKDTPMRWDKVALAVPSKSKAQCFRRFAELRKSFRSSKADGDFHSVLSNSSSRPERASSQLHMAG